MISKTATEFFLKIEFNCYSLFVYILSLLPSARSTVAILSVDIFLGILSLKILQNFKLDKKAFPSQDIKENQVRIVIKTLTPRTNSDSF